MLRKGAIFNDGKLLFASEFDSSHTITKPALWAILSNIVHGENHLHVLLQTLALVSGNLKQNLDSRVNNRSFQCTNVRPAVDL